MKLFYLLGFNKEQVFGSSASVTRLNLILCAFQMALAFFKEPAGIACYAFKALVPRGCILLE